MTTIGQNSPTAGEPGLHRAIGPRLLLFLVIGDMLGTGIYALTGDVAATVGGAAWLAFGGAFLVAMLTATSYLELVGKYPSAAGAALYSQRAFNSRFITFLVGFAVMCSALTSVAAASRAFSGYFQELAVAPLVVLVPLFILGLAFINFRGIVESVKVNVVLTCIELFGLFIVIAVGACAISGGPFLNHAEQSNGVDELLPVDLYIPGCPPHPMTILDGLLRLLGRLEESPPAGDHSVTA